MEAWWVGGGKVLRVNLTKETVERLLRARRAAEAGLFDADAGDAHALRGLFDMLAEQLNHQPKGRP